jgi:hypothetical protein
MDIEASSARLLGRIQKQLSLPDKKAKKLIFRIRMMGEEIVPHHRIRLFHF